MVSEFEASIRAGGVVVFPADTVYGLACDPDDAAAIERLYLLKGRPETKPSAVMFFSIAAAFAALGGDLGPRTRALAQRLLPGGLTLLVANPARRYPLACGPDPETLGIRIAEVPLLAGASVAVLQSSANASGGPDARRLEDVPPLIRAGADLVLDGGELPGTPSTVVDLRAFEAGGSLAVLREGAVSREAVERAAAEAR